MSYSVTFNLNAINNASGAFTQLGNDADTAFNKVSTGAIKVGTETGKASVSFKELGIGFTQAASGVMLLVVGFDNITNAATSLARAQVTVESSTERVRDAQEKYTKAVKEFGENSPQATEALRELQIAEDRLDVANMRLADSQTRYQLAIVQFGLSVVPAVTSIATGIGKLAEQVKNVDWSSVTSGLSNMSNNLKTAALGAAAFAISFGATYMLLQLVPAEYRTLAAVLAIVVASLVAVAIAALAAYGALSWGTAIPIILGAIGVGVAGLVVYLQQAGIDATNMGTSFEGATTKAGTGIEGVNGKFGALDTSIGTTGLNAGTLGENFKGATDKATLGLEGIDTKLGNINTTMTVKVNPAFENFKKTMEETATSKSWDEIINNGEEIGAVFIDSEGNVSDWGTAFQSVFTDAGTAITNFTSGFGTSMGSLPTTVATAWSGVTTEINNALNDASTAITTWWSGVVSSFNEWSGQLTTSVSTGWSNIVTTINGWMAQLQTDLATAWNNVTTAVSTAWTNITTAVSTGMSGIQSFLSGAMSTLSGMFSGAWETIKGVFSGAWSAIQSAASGAMSTLSGGISGGLNTISGFFSGARSTWEGILNGFMGFISGIVSGIQGAISGISSSISGAVSWAQGALSGLSNAASGVLGLTSKISGGGARQSGGIFTRPTEVLVGELGAEAIIPLNMLGAFMGRGHASGGNTYIIQATISNEWDLKQLASRLAELQAEEERARGLR